MRRRPGYYEGAHDERVEPHHDLDPDMPNPDWGGVIVQPNQKRMPAGDPTLWGGAVTTLIDNDPVLGSTPRAFYGSQIILAQAADRYARSWSLSGAVTLPTGWWESDTAVQPIIAPIPAIMGVTALYVLLSIVQGTEKITVEHQILLAAGGRNTNIGLCNNQNCSNGGPYMPTYVDPTDSAGSTATYPFAAIGALVGNTVTVRAFFCRGAAGATIPQATVSCLLTPYAPGSGI